MEDQITQISEIFAAPKGDLQVVMTYGSIPIYTSDALKKKFIKAMTKTSRVGPVIKTIEKLMNKGEFTPCYLTDRVIKMLLKKQPPQLKGFVGVTMGKDILIFVDNEANIFGFASNNELSITSLHELIHKAAQKFPQAFFQTFKSELTIFYHFYWSRIFSLDQRKVDVKKVQDMVSFIFFKGEFGRYDNKTLSTYHSKLIELFNEATTLETRQFQKIVQDYIVLIKIIWKARQTGAPSLIEKAVYAYKHLIGPLYTSYKQTFGINVKHIKEMCYQELYAPSEVISLPALVKSPSQKVYSFVNKL